MKKTLLLTLFALCVFGAYPLWADQPVPWQLGMQQPATPIMERITDLHDILLWIIFPIGIFVTLLIFYVMWRFRASKNPTPSHTTHNTFLEVMWTGIPVILLLLIAVPSIKLIYYMYKVPGDAMTLKVTGHQWYWSYEYPEHNIKFDSMLIEKADIKPGQIHKLDVDNRVIIPVDTNVRILMTSDDVLHSWAVPSFGVKRDTVPGKLNESWMRVAKEGVYYGQCSELCGIKHGFMPIAVEVVSKEKFANWVQTKAPPKPVTPPVATPAAPAPATTPKK